MRRDIRAGGLRTQGETSTAVVILAAVLLTFVAVGLTLGRPASADANNSGAPPFATPARLPFKSSRALKIAVTYSGSGSNETSYHATPPNLGGPNDDDTAHDTEAERWSLRFVAGLRVPTCSQLRCGGSLELVGARGNSSVVAQLDHVHIDGLYSILNASVSCELQSLTPAGAVLDAEIEVRYNATDLFVTALDPVTDALAGLPTACPGQGDSIDGLDDNYLGPGFSFAQGYGPDRWFTSATVTVPRSRLLHGRTVRLRLGLTRAGASPRDCQVTNPSYEQCVTSGSWTGLLVLHSHT